MIFGVGNDIVEVARIKKSLSNVSFYNGFFTLYEQQYIESKLNENVFQSAAGIFCAKEAFIKSIGKSFLFCHPKYIELRHTPLGQPYINLLKENLLPYKLSFCVSISHTKDYATATVIACDESK